MTKYNQITVEPNALANVLNALQNDEKQICYVVPCHEYDGTLIVVVYKEYVSNENH